METHERLPRDEPGARGSDRGFGLVFSAVSAAVGLWPRLDGGPVRGWALALAAALLGAALVRAAWLAPFHEVWFRFGLLLHRIVNPIVLAVIYYAAVTPTGLVLRGLGKDPLRLRADPNAESYWMRRDPPGPEPESMKHQF